jgi:hypothetical protein
MNLVKKATRTGEGQDTEPSSAGNVELRKPIAHSSRSVTVDYAR